MALTAGGGLLGFASFVGCVLEGFLNTAVSIGFATVIVVFSGIFVLVSAKLDAPAAERPDA